MNNPEGDYLTMDANLWYFLLVSDYGEVKMPLEQILLQKQTQKMVLSHQMQQALQILQLPLMELQQAIRQELVRNPTLEEVQEQKESDSPADVEKVENQDEDDEETRNIIDEMEKIASSQELWKEYLRNLNYPATTDSDEDKGPPPPVAMPSLQNHLNRQLQLSDCPDYSIGKLIIGNIDDDGYFHSSIREIADSSGAATEKVEEVLSLIQTFDPAGAGARDLRECLLIQLNARPKKEPLAIRIVSEHLPDLEKKKYSRIAMKLRADIEDVKAAVKIIAALEPKPGSKFTRHSPQYILPDITVKKIDDNYIIIVNDGEFPVLRINPFYRKLSKENVPPATKKYLADKFKSALWLIKSIDQRKRTIYRVAECIVKNQKGFFDRGISFLKPLRLKDVAEELNLHESTISRVTNEKYIETGQGIFELKYFFSGTLKDPGNTTSTRSIKSKVDRLIKNENPNEPLPDHKIAELMKKEGINIARRTVAKYREGLRILPVQLRKQY